jgi:hypothetical protein
MAGYSGKPLVQKLGFKPGFRVALSGAPPGFSEELRPLPEGIRLVTRRSRTRLDAVLLFAPDQAALEAELPGWITRLEPAGMLWVAWPKRAAKVATDLDENVVRRIGLAAGVVDVKVCAVNEVWSGLKFVRRLKDR